MEKTLLKRYSKTVYDTNGNRMLLMPKEVIDSFGKNLILDIYEDMIVMYPQSKLGKIKIGE